MTFKEYCDTCILSPLTCEIELNCKTKWAAGRKAMLDEVIEIIEKHVDKENKCYPYHHIGDELLKELRKKYGVEQ